MLLLKVYNVWHESRTRLAWRIEGRLVLKMSNFAALQIIVTKKDL